MKVLKLTESDLKRIVKRVIKEQEYNDETRALANSLWKLYSDAVDEQLNPDDFQDEFEYMTEFVKYLLDSGVEEGLIEEGTPLYETLSDYYYDYYGEYIFGKYDGTDMEEKASKVYDKLNRVYYKQGKESGTTIPNYILSTVINQTNKA